MDSAGSVITSSLSVRVLAITAQPAATAVLGESGETVRLGLTTSGALTLQGAPLFEGARIPARVRGNYAEYAFSQRPDGTITANVATRPPLGVSTSTAEAGGDLIEAIAGTGEEGYSGVGGPASEAQLDGPFGLAANANGNLFVTELSGRVRRISASPDRVGAQLGSSGEERTFSSSADGIVTCGGRLVPAGSLVSACNGDTYALTRTAAGGLAATYVRERQPVGLGGSPPVTLVRDESGAWRIGGRSSARATGMCKAGASTSSTTPTGAGDWLATRCERLAGARLWRTEFPPSRRLCILAARLLPIRRGACMWGTGRTTASGASTGAARSRHSPDRETRASGETADLRQKRCWTVRQEWRSIRPPRSSWRTRATSECAASTSPARSG